MIYRVALVFEPNETKARRLARDPGIGDGAKVPKEVAQVARLRVGVEVADKDLRRIPCYLPVRFANSSRQDPLGREGGCCPLQSCKAEHWRAKGRTLLCRAQQSLTTRGGDTRFSLPAIFQCEGGAHESRGKCSGMNPNKICLSRVR